MTNIALKNGVRLIQSVLVVCFNKWAKIVGINFLIVVCGSRL